MNDEQERLRRLRERQLSDRDPQVKQKQIQRNITHRERTERGKKYTLGNAWETLPHMYRAPIVIFLLGLVATIILTILWPSPWAIGIGLGATVALTLVGIPIGQAMDIRDNLKDYSKHR